ncbi:N-succinylarginine dihydrolase [Klebsiella pneumoniae subsp. pneumoniae]|nr:N-succinylarginine dihydrolase [Klebsiella pneumoniae subsp. pneumoniae]
MSLRRSLDGLVHLTVANLQDNSSRASEAPTTEVLLQAIFPDRTRFVVHPALLRSRPGLATKGRRTIIVSAASMAPRRPALVHGRRRGARRRRVAIRRGKPLRPARR